jgi:endonuclease-3 related protein
VVGAILTQNTAWTNVERAIGNLRAAGVLSAEAMRDLNETALAGTFRVKAARVKAFLQCLWKDHGGSLDSLLNGDLEAARRRLAGLHGVGPETADAMLLYAGGRPTFVVDAYTKRVLRRHLLIDGRAGYESVRALFHAAHAPDAGVFNEFHALLVTLGKKHCRSKARCDGCPLASLPHDPSL